MLSIKRKYPVERANLRRHHDPIMRVPLLTPSNAFFKGYNVRLTKVVDTDTMQQRWQVRIPTNSELGLDAGLKSGS